MQHPCFGWKGSNGEPACSGDGFCSVGSSNDCFSDGFSSNCFSDGFSNNCFSDGLSNNCFSDGFSNNCFSDGLSNCFRDGLSKDLFDGGFGRYCSSDGFCCVGFSNDRFAGGPPRWPSAVAHQGEDRGPRFDRGHTG